MPAFSGINGREVGEQSRRGIGLAEDTLALSHVDEDLGAWRVHTQNVRAIRVRHAFERQFVRRPFNSL